LIFEQKLELEARKNWRENVKRRREERKTEEEMPPAMQAWSVK
jgi:hypothetical protein